MSSASLHTNGEIGWGGSVMMFLLRVAFWLGLVLVLLPSGGSEPVRGGPSVGAADAVSAASAAVSDMRQFCSRQPDACTVGSQAAVSLGQRAQAGAKMLYEFLSERFGPHATGSLGSAAKTTPAAGTQDTLTPADQTPAWRGPAPRREAKRPT
jgi:hypothetical protein